MKVKMASEFSMQECLKKYDGKTKKDVIDAFLDGQKTNEISKIMKIPSLDVELIEMNYAINLVKSLQLSDRYASR